MKIRESVQLQTVFAMCEQEIGRDRAMPSTQALKTMVRRRTDQAIKTRNCNARSEKIETGVLVKKDSQREKVSVERRVGECHQWKATGQCSKKTPAVSVMIQRLERAAEFTDEKDNRPLPHQIRRPRLTEREKNRQQIQATEI